MAFKDTATRGQAMIKAAALGATHYQTWSTLYQGHWVISSLAFFDLNAPCDVPGCQLEIATWQAGLESFNPYRRPSCYGAGHNADRADREDLAITPLAPIPDEYKADGEGAL
ncbi:hypothetical protein JT328_gp11 [Aeromonas phage BUCT551]|uniref:Uncharacterized protein n=1 Tax=Aeromonas phage BUCT551 TaxID=2776735 RepID=A0A7L8ZJY1_9CAUD|nr:hypothetical protein JT328_gp11 [Aeromonas phage BUCT551]QOI69627.1 hypothetical protein [Aeromonas phage BUCT551]